MGDDYLWDRSGPPDPEVERLERALGKLRWDEGRGALPDAPQTPVIPLDAARRAPGRSDPTLGAPGRPTAPSTPRPAWLRGALLLAASLAALGALWAWLAAARAPRPPEARRLAPAITVPALEAPGWSVERLEGVARAGAEQVAATARLGVGEWLETEAASRARLTVAEIGVVEVGAESRVRLAATGPDQHRLDLQRGSISARVDAPPRLFVVGTPSATAVDLGCAYTLDVDAHGAGTLRVASGWVSLEGGGRASLVPAGATCRTRPGAGPGTPWFDDAPRALREALERFDFEGGGAAAVRIVLKEARKRDSLSLWHLLSRVDGALRRAVYDRLDALSPPPDGVGEPDVMRLDRPALDLWQRDLSVTW